MWSMRGACSRPRMVISLARLPKFDTISYSANDGLRIGAGARHRDIELYAYPLSPENLS